MKNKLPDIIFMGSLLIILAIGSYIQYNKIPVWSVLLTKNWSSNNLALLFSNKDSIGTITDLTGLLQRKKNDEYSFDSININEKVYFKDTFLTSTKTKAKITLNNGSIILLEPSTMIKLDFSDSQSWLSVSKKPMITVIVGNVETILKSPVEDVKIIKKPIVIQKIDKPKPIPMAILAEKPKNYDEIKKQSPQFEFKPETIKIVEEILKPNLEQKREIALETPKISKINLNYNVINSVNNSNKIKNSIYEDFKTIFQWSNIQGINITYNFIIYDSFHKVALLNIKTKKNQYIYDNYIVPNYTILKVKAYNEYNQLIGESSKEMFKFEFNPPTLNYSINNSTYDLSKKGKENVVLAWESTNFTKEYIVQISENNDFSFNNKTIITKNNFLQLKPKSGTYYVRVKSSNNYFESEWSNASVYNVINGVK